VFPFSDEHFGFYVADVSGHGVASAMLSTWLYHTLKPTIEQVSPLPPTTSQFAGLPLASPRSVAMSLDQMMSAKNSEHYLTLCYAIFHVPSRSMTYIRCGHPYPLLISTNGHCEVMEQSNSPAIGMSLGLPFEADTKKLQPGDRIYLYSDALIEALSPNGETFGVDRLCIELLASAHLKLQEQMQHILRMAQQFQNKEEFQDDITILAVEIPSHV
jgi:sigma-B regulation protein RsbU (phosphoserine phosphatase)